METIHMKRTALVAFAAVAMAGMAAPASAQAVTDARRQVRADRPLTVRHAAPVAPAYNPYVGAKALVTAPLAIASTIVSLPFRVTDAIFARSAGTPFVIVGTPLHYAGRIAQAPFRLVEAPFGGPAPFGETPSYF